MSGFTLGLELHARLSAIYEEMMCLARRSDVTAGRARGRYAHIIANTVRLKIRRFSGQVSKEAITTSRMNLLLEHYKRIQPTLTQLVERHKSEGVNDPGEFIRTLIDYEQVHIVATRQSYDAMKARGDSALAGIVLVPWVTIPENRQRELWKTMLRGKFANASDFALP